MNDATTSEAKMTIGLDLGDRHIQMCVLSADGVNAGPNLNSSRRSNPEHPQPRSSPCSTSLPLPLRR